MKQEKSLSIVIPALEERGNLELLLPGIIETCGKSGIEYEALVVDSDSRDGTETYVRELENDHHVKYLNEPVRGNLALAWDRGIMAARHPLVVTMDADLCHSPSFIPKLLEALEGGDMVIASRYLSGGRQMVSKNALFEVVSRGGQMLGRIALKAPYADISHGFRIFRKEMYVALRDKFTAQGNSYMINFTALAHGNGYSVREIPYAYGARKYGRDKMRLVPEITRSLKFLFEQWSGAKGRKPNGG